MQVINEITRRSIDRNRASRVVVDHIPGSVIFGYCNKNEEVINFYAAVKGRGLIPLKGSKRLLKNILIYSNYRGIYISKVDLEDADLLREIYCKGKGGFPYSFERRYEAIESFNIFEGKQKVINKSVVYNLSKYLKYSFGLEFETSQGYIPEELCFRDGLIPLRDGSIGGLEYSTVVLEGNPGIQLLHQQLETLKKYTYFNKECSLHIHFGGFPLDPEKLYRLYYICRSLESELATMLPYYTFNSAEYKESGKDYCKRLPSFRSFESMYESLVGRKFFGSLTQPHPNDIERKRKWQIPTRYYWVNFVNALCYNVNKTIEFRFLRPTYNFNKVVLWIYILNAIMYYAETCDNLRSINLEGILNFVYPDEVSKKVKSGITRLKILNENQNNNGDLIGHDIEIENELFPDNLNY